MTQVNIWKSPKKKKLFHSHFGEDTKWEFLAFLRLSFFQKMVLGQFDFWDWAGIELIRPGTFWVWAEMELIGPANMRSTFGV